MLRHENMRTCFWVKTWEWEDMREDKGLSKREHEVWVGLAQYLLLAVFSGCL